MREALMFACAAIALQGHAQTYQFEQPRQSPYVSCLLRLSDSEKLRPIRTKVPLRGVRDTPFSMLVLQEKPTPEERASIEVWAEARDECLRVNAPHFASQPPEQAAIATEYHRTTQRLLADLHSGRLTYGDFNKRRSELQEEFSKREDAAIARANPVRSQSDLDRDHSACLYEAQKTVATAPNRPISSGVRGSAGRNFDALIAGRLADRQQEDLYYACMRTKGWGEAD